MKSYESVHEKLQRVRRPHIHITFQVEKDGEVEVQELPTDLQFNVFCCAKRELCRDFAKSGDLDQSVMFDKIIRDKFDV